MEHPLVTAVILVHNAGPYLLPCLESVASQTWPALEAVVINNGSTDGAGAGCDAFASTDPRFSVLHGKNLGSTGGRAKGLAAAKGEYVLFVDGDDLLHPRFVQTLVEACLAAALPAAACRVVPFTGAPPAPDPGAGVLQSFPAPAHLRALLHNKQVEYSLCNKLYHRSLFAGVPFSCPVKYNEDLYLNWLLLKNAAGLALTDLGGYFYRQHPASITHRPLEAAFLTEQQWVASFIRQDAQGTALERSAEAFYYEKLLYLDSMILRQPRPRPFAALHKGLQKELRSGLRAALGMPQLAPALKLAALAACGCTPAYAFLCRALLTDRR
ncbi:glycosyltransferase family 2 protein [Allofournierella sp.]|uniref:glycosyltransferase family 2 protein n=1 Tax=Allofournierella sp. TaxID=1940256 RepID=UPI003AB20AF4